MGHVAQLVGAWVPSSTWPTDQFQGTKPVRLRVRPATEGTQPHHRRETFLYTLEYVQSAEFDRLLVATVQRAFPPHEHEQLVAHYHGLVGASANDQRTTAGQA